MTYQQTLDFLFQQLPMYQRIGHAAYKADLNSTLELMAYLGNPERRLKTIHVGGTNGKGSVSHLLASVFQEAGYKTGLYTSPHLLDFRERIRINGAMISEDAVMQFVAQHRPAVEEMKLSFFEWSVGLAFQHFVDQAVDIAIVEVGMGGRLDSTNVLTPELSIITNISMDHAQYLGDSLDKIAHEKAGIIKSGVPVIVGRSSRETEGVFRRRALQLESTIHFADQEFPRDVPPHPLKGAYQEENLQTVLIAIEVMQKGGWKIDEATLKRGFEHVHSNTGLQGRYQIVSEHPKVILDIAHNQDGLQRIVSQLKGETYRQLHMVLGFVSDKDVSSVLKIFPQDATIYLCEPSVPRAMPIERLRSLADQVDLKHSAFDSVAKAMDAAKSQASEDDLIYIGGSAFVVADALAHLA